MIAPILAIVAIHCFGCAPEPPKVPICPGLFDYPAIVTVYDPALGGINCDDDCSTVATGLFDESMYEVAGACPSALLGRKIHFPYLDLNLLCVDNGGDIEPTWSERDDRCIVFFDFLWRLEETEEGELLGAPFWNWWLVDWTLEK